MKDATSEHKAINDMMLYLRNKRVDEVNLIALAVTIGTIMPPKLFDGLVSQLADRFNKQKYFLVTAEDIIAYYFKRYHFHEDEANTPSQCDCGNKDWSPFDKVITEYSKLTEIPKPKAKPKKDTVTITVKSIEDLQRFTAVPINPDVISFAIMKSGKIGIFSREGDMVLSAGKHGYRVSGHASPSKAKYGLQRTRLAELKIGDVYVPRLNLADRIDGYVMGLAKGQACFFSTQGAVHLVDISNIVDSADVFKVVELQ